jgi:hypothetical protein
VSDWTWRRTVRVEDLEHYVGSLVQGSLKASDGDALGWTQER